MFLDHRRRLALAVLSLCLAPTAAAAQASAPAEVSGTVVDARTGSPVAGAAVSARGRRTGTDDAGGFRLCRLAAGETAVRADAPAHRPAAASVTLAPGGSAAVALHLEPDTGRPARILLDRAYAHAPRPHPPPMLILDGERVFVMTTGCETPVPGIRVVDELPVADITAIQVFRDDEAVARYGPEARQGVVVITTRRP